MAKRRMFSLNVIDTDIFIEMPQSSRLLYYELCMRADDDGFVSSPKKIQKMVGCNEDDFKILITKQFILPFESGIIVIKHWKLHNYIQKDRYTSSIYTTEKNILEQDENGVYTKCIQDGYEMDTQVRLGKVSKDKDSIDYIVDEKKETKKTYGEYKRIKLTDTEYNKLITDFGEYKIKEQIELMDQYIESNNNKNKYTNFNLVIRKSLKENWFNKTKNSKEIEEWLNE